MRDQVEAQGWGTPVGGYEGFCYLVGLGSWKQVPAGKCLLIRDAQVVPWVLPPWPKFRLLRRPSEAWNVAFSLLFVPLEHLWCIPRAAFPHAIPPPGPRGLELCQQNQRLWVGENEAEVGQLKEQVSVWEREWALETGSARAAGSQFFPSWGSRSQARLFSA